MAGKPIVGRSSIFTATAQTADASVPISYTWQLDNAAPVTHTGATSDTLAVSWTSGGAHVLKLTVANAWGDPVVLSRTVEVGVPVVVALLTLAGDPVVGESSSFTATVQPKGASVPISYTWQLDNDAPITHTGTTSDTFEVSWTSAGPHVLTVTIANGWGEPIVLVREVNVRKRDFRLYLPAVSR
jgi:hypothetical protein